MFVSKFILFMSTFSCNNFLHRNNKKSSWKKNFSKTIKLIKQQTRELLWKNKETFKELQWNCPTILTNILSIQIISFLNLCKTIIVWRNREIVGMDLNFIATWNYSYHWSFQLLIILKIFFFPRTNDFMLLLNIEHWFRDIKCMMWSIWNFWMIDN